MRNFSKIMVICLLLLIGTGEWLYHSGYGVRADAAPPVVAHQLSLEEAVPVQNQIASNGEGNSLKAKIGQAVSSTTARSSEFANPSTVRNRLPESIPTNPIINDLRTLYTKFATQHIKPGWLHLVYREEHPSSEGPIDTGYGLTIPPTYIFDTWYQINGSGQVVQGVTLMRDTSGQIIQASVYRDRIWHNLTIEENMSVDSPPSVRLDGRFLLHFEEAYNKGAQLTKTEVPVKGKDLIRFTYEEVYDTPTVISSSPKPMQRVRRSAYVDPDNSHLMILETVFTTTSGEELVTLRTTLLMIENVNKPPDEISAYLEQVK